MDCIPVVFWKDRQAAMISIHEQHSLDPKTVVSVNCIIAVTLSGVTKDKTFAAVSAHCYRCHFWFGRNARFKTAQ